MSEELSLDAVQMVREIRDGLLHRTSGMTPQEEIEFYNQSAERFRGEVLAELRERGAVPRERVE